MRTKAEGRRSKVEGRQASETVSVFSLGLRPSTFAPFPVVLLALVVAMTLFTSCRRGGETGKQGADAMSAADAERAIAQATELAGAGEFERAAARLRILLISIDGQEGTRKQQAEAHKLLGHLMVALERWKEGLEESKKALALLADVPDSGKDRALCEYNSGQALINLSRGDEALEALKRALSLYVKLPLTYQEQAGCHATIGMALFELGRDVEGIVEAKRALAVYDKLAQANIGDHSVNRRKLRQMVERRLAWIKSRKKRPPEDRTPLTTSQAEALAGLLRKLDESMALLKKGEAEKALASLREAQPLLKGLPQAEEMRARLHSLTAAVLLFLERYEEAIEEGKQALVLYAERTGTEKEEAGCYAMIDEALAKNPFGKALTPFSAGEAQSAVTASGEALRQTKEARKLAERGDHSAAVKAFGAAVAQCEKVPDSLPQQAELHQCIGASLVALGLAKEALAEYGKAITLYGGLNDMEAGLAQCRKGIGAALEKGLQQKGDKAIERLTPPQRSQALEAACLLYEAEALKQAGIIPDALRRAFRDYQTAAGLLENLPGMEEAHAGCRCGAAGLLMATGEFEDALGEFEAALAVFTRLGGAAKMNQAACHQYVSAVLADLGQLDEAMAHDAESLALFKTIPRTEAYQASSHVGLGNRFHKRSSFEEAIAEYRLALVLLAKEPGREVDRAACHQNIGVALYRLGRHQEAIDELREASAFFAGIPRGEVSKAMCQANIGKALMGMGKFTDAVHELTRARAVAGGWWIDDALAEAAEGLAPDLQETVDSALLHRLLSIQDVESQRRKILAAEHQMAWFEDRSIVYENMASFILRVGRGKLAIKRAEALKWGTTPEEIALHFADRGKGRTLLELIGNRILEIGDPKSSALLSESARLDAEINALLTRRGPVASPGKEAEFDAQTKEIERKQARSREIEAELARTAVGAFIEPELLKPAEFAKTLKPGEACIEYVACEKELLAFLVTADGVRSFRVEIARDAPRTLHERGRLSLEKLLAAYRHAPDRPEALGLDGLVSLQREWMDQWQNRTLTEAEHVAVSHALGRVLLPEDLRRALAAGNVRHLVIVPSRVSALTSFSSLVMGPRAGVAAPKTLRDSRFLVEDYSTSYVQALSLLHPVRKRMEERRRMEPPRGGLIAIADPIHDDTDARAKVPGVRVEADKSRSAADTVVRTLVRNVGIAPEKGPLVWHRLRETRREAETAAKEFGESRTYEDPILDLPDDAPAAAVCVSHAANRPLAKSGGLGRYRNILFGVHGYSDMTNPWLSSLMLTDLAAETGKRQPAPLTMRDVFAMKLNAETVVLAACQTARGRMRAGEGVVGFQLAFLFAGADSVVLTQWEVPSSVKDGRGTEAYPTGEIVTGFYRKQREGGAGRAESLRQAQASVLSHGGELADPFYWGAWQLYGEWR